MTPLRGKWVGRHLIESGSVVCIVLVRETIDSGRGCSIKMTVKLRSGHSIHLKAYNTAAKIDDEVARDKAFEIAKAQAEVIFAI